MLVQGSMVPVRGARVLPFEWNGALGWHRMAAAVPYPQCPRLVVSFGSWYVQYPFGEAFGGSRSKRAASSGWPLGAVRLTAGGSRPRPGRARPGPFAARGRPGRVGRCPGARCARRTSGTGVGGRCPRAPRG